MGNLAINISPYFCVIRVRIRSFSGPYFPAFGPNIVSIRIQSEYGKIRTRKTPNMDTFHAMYFKHFLTLLEQPLTMCFNVVLVFLSLTLNSFHSFFLCFHCWIWTSKCHFREIVAWYVTHEDSLKIEKKNGRFLQYKVPFV